MVRDDQGCVAVDISNRINEPFGVVEVEVKAFEEGLLFAKDIGIQDIILEGDSLIIHKALYGLSLAPTSMDSLTVGMQAFCGEFYQVSFSHVRCQGNRPAHLLTKHAKGIVDFSTWMEVLIVLIALVLKHVLAIKKITINVRNIIYL